MPHTAARRPAPPPTCPSVSPPASLPAGCRLPQPQGLLCCCSPCSTIRLGHRPKPHSRVAAVHAAAIGVRQSALVAPAAASCRRADTAFPAFNCCAACCSYTLYLLSHATLAGSQYLWVAGMLRSATRECGGGGAGQPSPAVAAVLPTCLLLLLLQCSQLLSECREGVPNKCACGGAAGRTRQAVAGWLQPHSACASLPHTPRSPRPAPRASKAPPQRPGRRPRSAQHCACRRRAAPSPQAALQRPALS